MATMYAWSPIKTADEKGKRTTVPFGETVTAEKLGVSKEDFDAMVQAGAVRETKPPDLEKEGFSGSVFDYYREKAREAALESGEAVEQANLEGLQAAQGV